MTDVLQAIRAIAGLAHSLAVHLAESWPVRGQGEHSASPPTNVTGTDLYRHLLNLKTLLFHFHPPSNPAQEPAWLQSTTPVLQVPDVAAALAKIELTCDQLSDRFGFHEVLSAVVDGQPKVLLTPTLNTTRLWQPPEGQPMPEIDSEEIRSLGWAAAKLLMAVGGSPPRQPETEGRAADEQTKPTNIAKQPLTKTVQRGNKTRPRVGAPRKNERAVDHAIELRERRPRPSWKEVWGACKDLREDKNQGQENFKAAVLQRERSLQEK
jgi:hypothetical protein